jgi:gliding motility-associated-like protein
LEVTYTVSEPSGSTSQVITRTIISGASNLLVLEQEINLFNALFTVRIEIADNCGTVFSNLFTIDPRPRITIQRQAAACGELFFTLQVRNYAPPFTLNFSNPSNFDPTLFNASYPGSFTSSPVVFGSAANTVPFGDYSVTVQERCGRTRQLNFLIEDKPINPAVTFFNNGCNSDFGSVKISMPDNRSIVGITLIEAPVAYPNALPANVIGSVNGQGVYNNTSLHVGAYTYVVVDSCGDTHTVELEVPAFVFGNLVAITRPDCSPTSGGVRISTSNGSLVSIKITAAPVTFENPLSYDVSFNIDSNGLFYMSGLPAGSYSFEAIDSCGYVLKATAEIAGYTRNSDGFLLNRTCTFFDLTLNNTDATITGKRFWLQKFFPATNSWGHPALGTAFVEGTIPTSATAIELFNFQTLTNSLLVGKLRVIKVFDSYNNGNPNGSCSDLYVEFDIISELVIFGTYNLSCNDASLPNDVVIDVQGAPPFNFAMTSPLAIDNGEDNTFLDLEDGNYIFQVTDICGNIKNIPLNIGNLLPLVRANAPKSMLVCRNDGVQFGVFPLVNQTPEILGTQNPNTYVVSFYLTQSDADNALNALPDGYTNISNPQTIYVRVQHKTILLCFATTSFAIFAGITPILSPEQPLYLCEGFTKILTAEAGYSSYLWSTGETTASITINAAGTYTVIVSNLYQDFSCDKVKNFIVTGSNRATILKIDTSDWTSSQNAVVVSVTGLGIYAYSLDNINFQTSNIFENLPAGTYRVYVKEVNGCGTVNAEFVLLNYPKFFTPNADGYNDTWHIQFSNFEPNLTVVIFDRFGKLITRLQSGDAGWDGMYNGQTLPSTDYWFAVTRQNGTIYKGHFSLRR